MKRVVCWMTAIGLCLLLVGLGLSALGMKLGATVQGLHYDRENGFVVDYGGKDAENDRLPDAETITALNLDLGGADCRIETGSAFALSCDDRVVTSVEDGVLSVTVPNQLRWKDVGTIVLTIPADFRFTDVTITYGAGDLNVSGLETENLTVTGGAGEADLEDVVAGICDLSIGVGELELSGVGELDLTLTGTEDDWDYDLRCGLGDLRFGETVSMDFSGTAQRQDGREKTLTAQCGVGELHIEFD
jgi:hypothetical protein